MAERVQIQGIEDGRIELDTKSVARAALLAKGTITNSGTGS
jgi:hypothetical protein